MSTGVESEHKVHDVDSVKFPMSIRCDGSRFSSLVTFLHHSKLILCSCVCVCRRPIRALSATVTSTSVGDGTSSACWKSNVESTAKAGKKILIAQNVACVLHTNPQKQKNKARPGGMSVGFQFE